MYQTIGALLLLLMILVFFIFLIGYGIRYQRARQLEMDEVMRMAGERGWQRFQESQMLTIRGKDTDNEYWQLKRDDEDVCWSTDISANKDWVYISGRRGTFVPNYASRIVQMLLRFTAGREAAAQLRSAREFQLGSAEFQRHYLVLATDIDVARHLLTPAVESLLIDWASTSRADALPQVTLSNRGLSIKLNGTMNTTTTDLLVRLGTSIKAQVRR